MAFNFRHRDVVNVVQVAPDNSFFISGSDDGTVRLWDCSYLENKLSNRSRLAISVSAGQANDSGSMDSFARGRVDLSSSSNAKHIKVKSLSFVGSDSIAIGTDSGTIHLYNIEKNTKQVVKETSTKYSVSYQRYLQQADQHIISLQSFSREGMIGNSLLSATSKGYISCNDLRVSPPVFEFFNDPRAGVLTSLVHDPIDQFWIVSGTARGVYTLWDVRFGIPVSSWTHRQAGQMIHRLLPHPNNSRILFSSIDHDRILAWDLNDVTQPRSLYSILSESQTKEQFDAELSAFLCDPVSVNSSSLLGGSDIDLLPVSLRDSCDILDWKHRMSLPSQRALHIPRESNLLISGGTDRQLHYWSSQGAQADLSRIDERLSRQTIKDVDICVLQNKNFLLSNKPKSRKIPNPSPDHRDCILDIKSSISPYHMLITASRDGFVKVWK